MSVTRAERRTKRRAMLKALRVRRRSSRGVGFMCLRPRDRRRARGERRRRAKWERRIRQSLQRVMAESTATALGRMFQRSEEQASRAVFSEMARTVKDLAVPPMPVLYVNPRMAGKVAAARRVGLPIVVTEVVRPGEVYAMNVPPLRRREFLSGLRKQP